MRSNFRVIPIVVANEIEEERLRADMSALRTHISVETLTRPLIHQDPLFLDFPRCKDYLAYNKFNNLSWTVR